MTWFTHHFPGPNTRSGWLVNHEFNWAVQRRSFWEIFEIADPKVRMPAMLIMGEKDYLLKFPGIEDYVRSGKVNDLVPGLEVAFLPEGTHFVPEQSPEEVNDLILTFLRKHLWWKHTQFLLQMINACMKSMSGNKPVCLGLSISSSSACRWIGLVREC